MLLERWTRWKLPGSFLGQCLMEVVFISYGCYHKIPQTGWLRTPDVYCLSSGGRKSEISVGRAMHLLKALWKNLFQSSFLASGSHRCSLASRWLFPMSLLTVFFPCLCIQISPFSKDISHIRIGPLYFSVTSFCFITLVINLFPNKVTLQGPRD